jgi:histidine triad (HIT) family protein
MTSLAGAHRLATRLTLRAARSRPGGWLVRAVFAHATGLLPVSRADDSPNVIAFRHPRPLAPPHVLLVPKRSIPSLRLLAPSDAHLVVDLVAMAARIAGRLGPADHELVLVINGGASQDVAQLHAHLLPAPAVAVDTTGTRPDPSDLVDGEVTAYWRRPPSRPTHIVVEAPLDWPALSTVQRLVARFQLDRPGFSLVLTPGRPDRLHLVSRSAPRASLPGSRG